MTRRQLLQCAGAVTLAAALRPIAAFGQDDDPPLGLTLEQVIPVYQGNASNIAFSDDGRYLFVANEEGSFGALKLDVSDPVRPKLVAQNGAHTFPWAVSATGGIVLFRTSLPGDVFRVDATTLTDIWDQDVGTGHTVCSNGLDRIFVPSPGIPALLHVLDAATGAELASVAVPEGWQQAYSIRHDPVLKRLYVGSGTTGIYIYDVTSVAPVLLGKISSDGSDIALRGTRVWLHNGATIEQWDASNPAVPVMTGAYTIPAFNKLDAPEPFPPAISVIDANTAGTRLVVTYFYRDPTTGAFRGDAVPAGAMLFDVTGVAPALLSTLDMPMPSNPFYRWDYPLGCAISPDGSTLAVTVFNWGVFLCSLAGDTITPYDIWGFETSGEGHDIYLTDDDRWAYIFANQAIQIVDRTTNARTARLGPNTNGRWCNVDPGVIALPQSSYANIWKFHDGILEWVAATTNPPNGGTNWTVAWDSANRNLYAAGETQYVSIWHLDPVTYAATLVGQVQLPQSGAGAVALTPSSQLWVVGWQWGIAAFDVSNPAAPVQIFTDLFTGNTTNRAGAAYAQGRAYMGCSDQGVRIYDPVALRQTGSIDGLTVNFLDVYQRRYLVVANSGYPVLPDGMYVYDLAANPDAPSLIFNDTNGGFASRAFDTRGKIVSQGLTGANIYRGS